MNPMEATRIYQAFLEAHRRELFADHQDNRTERLTELTEHLDRARRDMEVAWLEALHKREEPA